MPPVKLKVTFLFTIRKLVQAKWKARRIWHHTRHPWSKTVLNKITEELTNKIKDLKNETFHLYLSQLDSTAKGDYTL